MISEKKKQKASRMELFWVSSPLWQECGRLRNPAATTDIGVFPSVARALGVTSAPRLVQLNSFD